MPLESLTVGALKSIATLAQSSIKETWNKLDAASEKPKPSEYLSQRAVSAIQGVSSVAGTQD